jgi:hypothetical protein
VLLAPLPLNHVICGRRDKGMTYCGEVGHIL